MPTEVVAQVDRVLLALRASGPDAYRASEAYPNQWRAYCPCCRSELVGVRSLWIYASRSGGAQLTCQRECSTEHILKALQRDEERYAEGWPSQTCPAIVAAVTEVELERIAREQRIIRNLRRCVSEGLEAA
jgi:hypothetical protein